MILDRVGYRAIKKCEEYDPTANKWSDRADFYGDWRIASGCIAADTETGRVYSLGGYSLDDRYQCLILIHSDHAY